MIAGESVGKLEPTVELLKYSAGIPVSLAVVASGNASAIGGAGEETLAGGMILLPAKEFEITVSKTLVFAAILGKPNEPTGALAETGGVNRLISAGVPTTTVLDGLAAGVAGSDVSNIV